MSREHSTFIAYALKKLVYEQFFQGYLKKKEDKYIENIRIAKSR